MVREGVWVWDPHEGGQCLRKWATEGWSALLLMCEGSVEAGVYSLEEGSHHNLTLCSQASSVQMVRNKCLLFKSLSLW